MIHGIENLEVAKDRCFDIGFLFVGVWSAKTGNKKRRTPCIYGHSAFLEVIHAGINKIARLFVHFRFVSCCMAYSYSQSIRFFA